MQKNNTANIPSYLIWVFPDDIRNTLDAATWLETTKEMRNLGWRVDLLSAGAAGRCEVQGVDVICFPQPKIYLVRHLIFHMHIILYILQNWNLIDVVFFHQLSLPWLLPLRLLNIFGKKHPVFVMDTRTVPMESAEKATLKDKIHRVFYFLMNGLANRLTNGQTVITQRMADLLHVPHERLWGTWPSGVNLEKFSVAFGKRQWTGAHDPINVIYIGSLHYERNLTTLCKAVIAANQAGMSFKLLLYGEGTEKKDLQTFAADHQGVIAVFDRVDHDQIPTVLSSAHVGVLPFPDEDKYRVSSPIKLFEYMGAGMPILATRIVCHTDVVGSGDYVFWAENADVNGILDALQQIWRARLSLADMGEKSLSAASNWTYKSSAKRLNNALQYGLSLYCNGEVTETSIS